MWGLGANTNSNDMNNQGGVSMNNKSEMKPGAFMLAGIWLLFLFIQGCSPALTPAPVLPGLPTMQPTLSLAETSAKEFSIPDFSVVHAPVNGDSNEHLIFGSLTQSKPAVNTPPDLAAFLGRWEGYSYAPPVKKDRKIVLFIQEITEQGGKLYGWSGTNLQYPDVVEEAHFRVTRDKNKSPAVEFQMRWSDGSTIINTFSRDAGKDILQGKTISPASGMTSDIFELTREHAFFVYRDYEKYLASKRITTAAYRNPDLAQFGKGYMLYLPEGYEANSTQTWPLIFFLHGSGDRGNNLLLLAKASPFMYIREKGPLPAIIVAPLLTDDKTYALFPEAYMDGVLAEIQADYKVDPKRIYVTGLSLGGEAAYRFALHRPHTFAAVAPLCAFLQDSEVAKMNSIKDIPVWTIHGADDTVIPLAWAEKPVNALKDAGGNVKFTILPGHDHDVWSDTYSDPAFFDWLLKNKKP
jgi:predicted esterase